MLFGIFESQGSKQYLQRGWNLHPEGGYIRFGTIPGMVESLFILLPTLGIEEINPFVYGW